MENTVAIKTINLTKVFTSKGNQIIAVDRVNLNISQGEIFGLMGPNGAGKTTLLKMLTTLIIPSSGEAFVAGHDIRKENKVKDCIGVIFTEERSFYWRLTGKENMRFFATLHNLSYSEMNERIDRIAETIRMKDFIDKRFDSLSTGMKQKLSIARSLIGNPQILFTDEPTKGLDPISASQIRETLKRLSQTGITIFLITHSIEEAGEVCQRVAIMDKGKIKAEVRPEEVELKDFMMETIGDK